MSSSPYVYYVRYFFVCVYSLSKSNSSRSIWYGMLCVFCDEQKVNLCLSSQS